MKTKTVKDGCRSLKCVLTTDEEREMGKNLAALQASIEECDFNMRPIKDRKKQAQLEQTRVAGILNDGYEYRPIECEKELNFDEMQVVVRRLDTFETVEDRKMRDGEKQSALDGTEMDLDSEF